MTKKLFKHKINLCNSVMLPISEVCFFKLIGNRYMTENDIEITTEMLSQYPHHIFESEGFIKLN